MRNIGLFELIKVAIRAAYEFKIVWFLCTIVMNGVRLGWKEQTQTRIWHIMAKWDDV
jgi:hypothetical protein